MQSELNAGGGSRPKIYLLEEKDLTLTDRTATVDSINSAPDFFVVMDHKLSISSFSEYSDDLRPSIHYGALRP
ncbi:unnamed protein product, partial [Aphanomyces euteiches]